MFSRWGAFVYRARRPIVLGSLLVAVAMGFFATNASSHLSSGGWLDPGSESARVADRLAADFGSRPEHVVVLFRGAAATTPPRPDFQAIADTLAPVTATRSRRHRRASPRPATAASSARRATPPTPSSSSRHGRPVGRARRRPRAKLAPPAGYSVQLTGYGPLTEDSARSPRRTSSAPRPSASRPRDHPHPRLRQPRRRGHAARRRRPDDPHHPRPHLLRQPGRPR